MESILSEGKTIDAIAANHVTAKWTVYDRFPSVGSGKCVTPKPYTWPNFLKVSNLMGVANQTAIYAIIAIGMTMVIITAGIDLSVGSLVALASVSSAIFIRDYCGGANASLFMIIAGILLGIGICAAAGSFNGLMVTAFQIPPFIVTLGMMMMASGLSFRLAEGRSIPELPSMFFWLGARCNIWRTESGSLDVDTLSDRTFYHVENGIWTLYLFDWRERRGRTFVGGSRETCIVSSLYYLWGTCRVRWDHADLATFCRRSQIWINV